MWLPMYCMDSRRPIGYGYTAAVHAAHRQGASPQILRSNVTKKNKN